jgi:hypothetical protein
MKGKGFSSKKRHSKKPKKSAWPTAMSESGEENAKLSGAKNWIGNTSGSSPNA